MADQIILESGESIAKWEQANCPVRPKGERAWQGIGSSGYKLLDKPGKRALYGVKHFFYSSGGDILVGLERIFKAYSAEEALQQYLTEPSKRQSGRGDRHVSFKVYAYPASYKHQKIKVDKVEGGTDDVL